MRRQTVLTYAFALFAACGLVVGCTGDDTSGDTAHGGKSSGGAAGKGGTSAKGGSAGSKSDAGDAAGGAGGVATTGGTHTTGGAQTTGGTQTMSEAGMAAGGEGGMGSDVSLCGNGVVDAGETCDGTAGCSVKCTSTACDTCEAANIPPTRPFTVGDCSKLTVDGDSALCQAVLDCVTTTGCADADKAKIPYRAGLPCYCGAMDYDACSKAASSIDLTGDCKGEINAASKLTEITPNAVLVQFTQFEKPLGAAMTQVDDPGPLPEGCSRLSSATDRKNCQAIVACAYRTGCADAPTQTGAECYCGTLDTDTCFLNTPDPADPALNGACKAEIQKAAGGDAVSPLEIGQLFNKPGPVSTFSIFIGSKVLGTCTDECFPK